jgi:hypothetical protein
MPTLLYSLCRKLFWTRNCRRKTYTRARLRLAGNRDRPTYSPRRAGSRYFNPNSASRCPGLRLAGIAALEHQREPVAAGQQRLFPSAFHIGPLSLALCRRSGAARPSDVFDCHASFVQAAPGARGIRTQEKRIEAVPDHECLAGAHSLC